MDTIDVFTDGSCRADGQFGGLGVYMVVNGKEEISLKRGYRGTTTPRMEMRAFLEAVRMVNPMAPVLMTIYVDSQFVANSFIKGWLSKWRMANYVGVANADLWRAIVREIDSRRLMKLHVKWVRGHGSNYSDELVFGNAIADSLASYKTQDSFIDDSEEKLL